MRGALLWGLVAPCLVAAALADKQWGGLAEGPGRDEVFALCDGCHSLKLVKQQRLDRDTWDETLVWMVEEQGMAQVDPETRNLILDYLILHFGRDVPR